MTQICEIDPMQGEFVFRFTEVRAKLVRQCFALTGDRDAAEDLAQETLGEAWRHRSSLRNPEAADAWFGGIARNVCRRWHRQRSRAQPLLPEMSPPVTCWDTTGNPWEELDQAERAALLDRAMGMLAPKARQSLAARYWDEMPLSEIAARAGVTENTAAARLSRAREALRAVLTTRLAADAAEFGLTAPKDGWQETRIWCFRCGRRRLEERRAAGAQFGVRCPQCDSGSGEVAFSTGHGAINAAQLLGTVQTCKPALRRVNAWWDTRLRRSLRTGTLPCWRCAGAMTRKPASGESRATDFGPRLLFDCLACRAEFSLPASGLAFHSGAVQQFWQRHPRIRVLPERRTEAGAQPLIITRYEAVGETASIEVVYDAASFQPLGGPASI